MKKNASLEVLDKQVRKSNDLIQKARFNLTVQQQKIILYLISQINPSDKEFQYYDFNILDFCRICGIDNDSGRTYLEVKEQIKKLADKSYWIILEDGDTEVLVRWLDAAILKKNSGIIRMRLNGYLKPYLLQLKEKYTEYQLAYTLYFKSKYSIKLYELVCMIHFHELETYNCKFDLHRLKKLLDCTNYCDYRDFKKRVLDKAIKEINECSDKTISYRPITRGRKVIELELSVSTKTPAERVKIEAEIEKKLQLDK